MPSLDPDLRAMACEDGREAAEADVEEWEVASLPAKAASIIRDQLDGDLAAEVAAQDLAIAGDFRLALSDHLQALYAFEWEAAYLGRLVALVDIVDIVDIDEPP